MNFLFKKKEKGKKKRNALLANPPAHATSLRDAAAAVATLTQEGHDCPSWTDIATGRVVPDQAEDPDGGEFTHGWQFKASRAREQHAKAAIIADLTRQGRDGERHLAMLRQHEAKCSGAWLFAMPTSGLFTIDQEGFATALRRRLCAPLAAPPRGERLCPARACRRAGTALDSWGDHLAACPHTGRVQRRAKPIEKAWSQVFAEAGGWTDEQAQTRDLGLPGCSPDDRSRPDGVTYALPVWAGLPGAWDVTLRSPIARNGSVRPAALRAAGSTFTAARRQTQRDYPAIRRSGQIALVCLAGEVGGAWAPEVHALIRRMARAKAERAAPVLRQALRSALATRWWRILSCAVQRAVAASLRVVAPARGVALSRAAPILEDCDLVAGLRD